MNGNEELLNFIYQNAEMGTKTLEQIVGIVKEEEFKLQLQSQQNEYHNIRQEVKKLLVERGFGEKGVSSFDKVKTYLMINMQTLTNQSNSHIAELLLTGTNAGIVEANKQISNYAGADKEIIKLVEKLLAFEEKNCRKLKELL